MGAVLDWLAAASAQTTVLVAVIALIDRAAAGRVRPELRHGLWMLVAVKLVLPPGLPALWWGLVPLRTGAVWGGAGMPVLATAPAWPVIVWAAGVFVALTITWRRGTTSRRALLAASSPAGPGVLAVAGRVAAILGLARPPAVRLRPGLSGPLVVGLRRPVVLLPAEGVARWSAPDLEHVLGHELAHVRRGDLWLESAFTVLNAVYWFHPLVYIARRRAHRLRELCCDATVAARLGPAYRSTLLRLAADQYLAPAGTTGMWSGGSLILSRLRALERRASPGSSRRTRVVTAAALGLASVVLLPMGVGHGEAAVQELASARGAVARAAADSAGGMGSLHVPFAVQRLNALEGRGEGRGEQ